MGLQSKSTEYGTVHRLEGGCKDDWDNITRSEYYETPRVLRPKRRRPVAITLQRPALKALKAAEAEIKKEIVVTGSIRTCEQQAALYQSDPNRYAPPSVGLHCQGLAIDVNTGEKYLTDTVRAALKRHGWTQARPDDEPWHFSYGWTA